MRRVRGLLFFAIGALVTACSSGVQQNAPLPVAPTTAPGSGGVPTVDGFPISIKEFALPGGQGGPGKPVVGPDGAIWFPAGLLQIDRVTGTGAITKFTAPSVPPGNPDGTWSGFGDIVSYAGSIFAEFTGEGGEWGHPFSILLARVTQDGVITPSIIVGPDGTFAGMVTDKSGALWVLVGTLQSIVARHVWNGSEWVPQDSLPCRIDAEDAFAIAAGPDGNLYAAANLTAGPASIFKISPSCTQLARFEVPAAPTFWSPAMTFGPDGNLWILNRGTAVIDRMTPSGTFTQFTVPFAGSAVAGITKGSDGAIWFTDAGTNAVGRITMDGSFAEFPVPTSNAFTTFGGGIVSCPQKCDGAHGRLWFSEDGARKIARLEF